MPERYETNVRVPQCVWDALAVIARSRVVSRDEAVRQVLEEHVELQEQRRPEDQLTHISTVLRYPPMRRFRTQAKPGRQLRLRIAPRLAERARLVSLKLPGQSPRAHRDYQARLLTDAVVTAIAVAEPFTDEFLDGLPPLLRHGTALGLWQLAVAATSSAPENAVLDAAEWARGVGPPETALSAEEAADRERLLLVADALEEVAWHDSARFAVATNIARRRLRGPGAAAYEKLLYDQRTAWDEARQDLRHSTDKAWLREGIPGWYDTSGRGGGAVWRAQRRVELQDFADWLVGRASGPRVRRVQPPGWLVRVPERWCARVVPAGIPEPFASWAAAGRVLVFPAQERQVLWPLTAIATPPGLIPIPGMEPVIATAARLSPEKIGGFIESLLLDWQSADDEHREIVGQLEVPAGKALDFGLIDAAEHRQIMACARAATLQSMAAVIQGLHDHQLRHRDKLRDAAALGNARQFGVLAAELGIQFGVVKAMWHWPIRSVAEEVLAGTRSDAVQWLAGWVHRECTRTLQRSMEQAWHAAFDHLPASHWTPETPDVTPTNTTFGSF